MANDERPDDDEGPGERASEADVPDAALSLNAILELLAHHDRRLILRFLSEAPDHTATVDELVNHLIEEETEQTGKRPGRDQLKMQLHHTHLPKLTEAGVVEYDTRSQELRYWRHERLEDILEYLQSHESN